MRLESIRAVATRAAGGAVWTAFTAGELAALLTWPNGRLVREGAAWPSGRRNIRVEYEHGADPIPLELKRAAMTLLAENLKVSDLPERATAQTSELGTFQLAVAGRRGEWFGLPSVDSVLSRLSEKVPGVG
jgi:hypothetical protein